MDKRIVTRMLAPCLLLGYGLALAQQDHAGPAEQVGSEHVSFTTSCDAAVAGDFNHAIALYHSFWFTEAIDTFEEVLAADPECAMAHWGIAMSHWGNPFAGQRNPQQLERGLAAIERARAAGSPAPREQAYIDAAAELFADERPGTQFERTTAYEEAMEQLAQAHPDDMEAQIFHALAVNQNALPTDDSYSKQLQAARILEPLFEDNPEHPGIAHYIIHAYDHPPLAERALEAAERYASLAPDAPHALHMPSHTFTRVGLWQASVDTNRRSADIASSPGVELHALDYMTYAYLQMGRDRAAREVAARAEALAEDVDITAVGATQAGAFAIAAIPARYALERGDFEAAANLSVREAASTPHTQAMTHFARALGAARSGNTAAAAEDLEMLAELRDRAAAQQDGYWAEQVGIQLQTANGWVAFAEGRQEEGIAELGAAADREDATEKSAVTPGPLAPARELLGAMLMESDQPGAALQAFEATLEREPNRFRALHGAARAADAIGDTSRARQHYSALLEVAGSAGTERPALQEARRHLGNDPQ